MVRLRLFAKPEVCAQKGYDRSAVVIASEAVQPVPFEGRRERVPGPAGDGFHRVDVRVHEDGRAFAGGAPEVVSAAVRVQALLRQPSFQEVGDGLLVPAEGRDGNELMKETRH